MADIGYAYSKLGKNNEADYWFNELISNCEDRILSDPDNKCSILY